MKGELLFKCAEIRKVNSYLNAQQISLKTKKNKSAIEEKQKCYRRKTKVLSKKNKSAIEEKKSAIEEKKVLSKKNKSAIEEKN